jgi:hypothetical protein
LFILGVPSLACCGRVCAQTPEDAVRRLARNVAELRDAQEKASEKISLEWVNASSLPEAESIILREAFLKELAAHRAVSVADPGVAAGVRVSVRETPTEFLVVARVMTATGEQVRMTGLLRTAFLPVMNRGNGLRLTKLLLWQQAETVLDAGEFADEVGGVASGTLDIFLLKPEGVAIYREADERLNEIQELPFSGSSAGYKYVSRGLRGELRGAKDGAIAVTMPGLSCAVHGSASAGERWTMTCAPAPATALSTTKTPGAGPNATASDANMPSPEVVTLTSSCDGSLWRLMGEASDWTQADRLLLVNGEMKREEAVASVEFAGPVRRLAGAEDGKSAVAVVFNLSSGSYEIYRITMVCGR